MHEYQIKEVIKVVDGDTIDIVIDLGFSIFTKQRIRLAGIDTPESITKDIIEKQFGLEAKEALTKWLGNQKTLKIVTTKDDKYGRMLGVIFGDTSIPINDTLISCGYAWKYNGDAKRKDFASLLEQRKTQ